MKKCNTDLLYQKCSMTKKKIRKKLAYFDYLLAVWKELNFSEEQSKKTTKQRKRGCYFHIASEAWSKWMWVLKLSHHQNPVSSKHRLKSSFLKRHFKVHSEVAIQRGSDAYWNGKNLDLDPFFKEILKKEIFYSQV